MHAKSKYKELFLLSFICIIIFSFNILLEYLKFIEFKENKHVYYENLSVLQSYTKTNAKGRTYRVLKLQGDDFSFYTTTNIKNDFKRFQSVNLRAINTKITFLDYLSKNLYMPSYNLKLSDDNILPRNKIITYFLNQHTNEKIIEFYGALFFALPISLELRTDVNYYGIAHLIAISGYHISLIFSLFFLAFSPIYSFFQKRYFPYRNARLDLSMIVFVFLFFYAYLIGFVPSYIRSLVMALWVFYLLAKDVKIINFVNLFFSVLICVALFPQLLFSVGFLFSVMGVFFIFLYVHHFYLYSNHTLSIVLLNIWTFFAMIIPVLCYFPLISFQQLLSLPLIVVFTFFYPLVLFLHIFNIGDLLDNILLLFFDFKIYATNLKLPLWVLLGYIILSLVSIRYKYIAIICVALNLFPFFVLI